jgi:hypothetical protein
MRGECEGFRETTERERESSTYASVLPMPQGENATICPVDLIVKGRGVM